MKSIVTIPDSVITLGTNDFNQNLYSLKENAEFRGADKFPKGDVVEYHITPSKLPIDALMLVVSNGGEVENFPVFIEIESPETLVPEAMPYPTKVDEDGVESRKTWQEWLIPNCYILELDGKFYVESGHCGRLLKGSELIPVFDSLVHPNRIRDIQSTLNVEI